MFKNIILNYFVRSISKTTKTTKNKNSYINNFFYKNSKYIKLINKQKKRIEFHESHSSNGYIIKPFNSNTKK